MNAIDQPKATPPTIEEARQEDAFEKELVDHDQFSPFHQNGLAKIFLGGVLIFGMILFYIDHISGTGHLGTYGQSPVPAVNIHAAKP